MCVRIVYSHIQREYILHDGSKIPDSTINHIPDGAAKLQAILEAGERKSPRSWLVNKERILAFREATQQMELRRCSRRESPR